MSRITVLLVCVVLLNGCDDQAASRQAATRSFHHALDLIHQAHRGYIPADHQPPDDANADTDTDNDTPLSSELKAKSDTQAYRHHTLAQAAAALNRLIDNSGDNAPPATRRVLAELYASEVLYLNRKATEHWADLASLQSDLRSHMALVTLTDSRASRFDPNQQQPLDVLQRDREQAGQRVHQIETDTEQLRREAEHLQHKIDQQKQQAEQALTESQRLDSDALTAQEAEKQPLYDRSTEARMRSKHASTQVQQHLAHLELVRSRLAILDIELQSARDADRAVSQQLQSTREHRQTLGELRDQALRDKAQAVQHVLDDHDRLAQALTRDIGATLDQAAARMEQALQLLHAVTESSPPASQAALRMESLSKHVGMANTLTEHIQIQAEYGRTLVSLSDLAQRTVPEHAPAFTEALDQTRTRQQQLVTQAQQAIEQSLDLANQLTQDSDPDAPLTLTANRQAALLHRFSRLIDESQF